MTRRLSSCSSPLPGMSGIYLGTALLGGIPLLTAADTPPTLESAGSLEIDNQGKTLRAPEGAVLYTSYGWLQTGHLVVDLEAEKALAGDPVLLQFAGGRLLAESLDLSWDPMHFSAHQIRWGQPPFYAESSALGGHAERLHSKDVRLYPHEPRPLSPFFRLREAEYLPDEETFRGESVTLGIGRLPLLYWPRLSLSTEGLAPEGTVESGYRSHLGAYAGVRLYLPVSGRIAPGGEFRALSERGLLLGPGLRYQSLPADAWFADGSLQTGWIADQGDPEPDRRGQEIPTQRGFIDAQQQWDNRHNLSFQSQIQYWSDSEVTRDFRPDLFRSSPYPSSYFATTWQQAHWQLHAFSRVPTQSFEPTPERLPEVQARLLPLTLPGGWWLQGHVGAAALREKSPPTDLTLANPRFPDDSTESLRSDRLDAFIGTGQTFTSAPGIHLTPSLGGRVTHYERPLQRSSPYTRFLAEFALEARGELTGQFDTTNAIWDVNGLRHRIFPYVEYRWIPETNRGQDFLPPIDRPTLINRLPLYDLNTRTDIDALEKTHLLRFGLDQTLETRDARHGSRELLFAGLTQDWHFNGDPRRDDSLPPLQTETRLAPAPWLTLYSFQRLDTRSAELREWHNRLVIRDLDFWELGFNTYYRTDGINQFALDGQRQLNERFTALAAITFDAEQNRLTEQFYGLRQTIQDTWDLDYGLRFRRGDDREGSFSLSVTARLLAF